MYENFFTSVDGDHSSEPPSCKTISVLRDPNDVKRSATNICWHPDGTAKMAVSYSVMQFQKMPPNMPTHSYIWDVNSPNEPEYTLTPPSPACALAFNARSPDWLVGGLYNGLIGMV
jgi:dynein intermediate chain 2